MLKGIPTLLTPDLLKIMMEMGHGDEIVIGDGNFPAASNARRLVRCDATGVPPLLDAVMRFFPLDTFTPHAVALMGVVPGDNYTPDLWPVYEGIIRRYEPQFTGFEYVDRFAFYERARQAYAIVSTGEPGRYANIILRKGIVEPGQAG